MKKFWWKMFGGKCLVELSHTLGLGSTLNLSLSMYVCLCLFVVCKYSSRYCHHQMISFQKIYGLYGLKHHSMEINGDVTIMETTNPKVKIGLVSKSTKDC